MQTTKHPFAWRSYGHPFAMRSCDELFIKKEGVFTEAEFKQKLPEESVTYQRILKSAVQ